jgi:hypothetical protein
MADTAKITLDLTDFKLLNDHLNKTDKKMDMTAKTAKKEFDKLTRALDPVAKAMKQTKDQVIILQKAVVAGAISQKEYAASLAMITKNAAQSGITLNQYGAVVGKTTRGVKKFGSHGMQQVGYQVQDFAVQVQGGTNAMVALGQQGSQLLGIFGPAGAIAGMILAIGTGLAGAFMAAKRATDNFTDSTKSFGEVMKTSQSYVADLTLQNYMLVNSISSVEEADLKRTLTRLKAARDEKRLSVANNPILNKRNNTPEKVKAYVDKVRTGAMGSWGETFKKAIDTIEARIKVIEALNLKSNIVNAIVDGEENILELANEQENVRDRLRKTAADSYRLLTNSYGLEGSVLLAKEEQIKNEQILLTLRQNGADINGSDYKTMVSVLEVNSRILVERAREKEIVAETSKAKAAAAKADAKAKAAEKKALADLIKLNKVLQDLTDDMASSLENGFMAMVEGTKSVKEAFKSMASDIIKQLFRVLVIQNLVGGYNITSGEGSGLAGYIGTGVFGGTAANGGPVQGGRGYMVGERGPELFTPSVSGNITPNSQVGGGGVTIVQNINVSTGVQATVRAEIRGMMPQIANSAKGAVLDAKRRGGAYGSAFA